MTRKTPIRDRSLELTEDEKNDAAKIARDAGDALMRKRGKKSWGSKEVKRYMRTYNKLTNQK